MEQTLGVVVRDLDGGGEGECFGVREGREDGGRGGVKNGAAETVPDRVLRRSWDGGRGSGSRGGGDVGGEPTMELRCSLSPRMLILDSLYTLDPLKLIRPPVLVRIAGGTRSRAIAGAAGRGFSVANETEFLPAAELGRDSPGSGIKNGLAFRADVVRFNPLLDVRTLVEFIGNHMDH